jgi:hypothetical protein
MAEVKLNRPCVLPRISKVETCCMTEHLRMDWEVNFQLTLPTLVALVRNYGDVFVKYKIRLQVQGFCARFGPAGMEVFARESPIGRGDVLRS